MSPCCSTQYISVPWIRWRAVILPSSPGGNLSPSATLFLTANLDISLSVPHPTTPYIRLCRGSACRGLSALSPEMIVKSEVSDAKTSGESAWRRPLSSTFIRLKYGGTLRNTFILLQPSLSCQDEGLLLQPAGRRLQQTPHSSLSPQHKQERQRAMREAGKEKTKGIPTCQGGEERQLERLISALEKMRG